MRFLWIVPQPFYSTRGTPMNVRRLLDVVASHGHEVDVVTYPLGEDVRLPPGVRVFRAARLPFVGRVPIGPSFRKLPLDGCLLVRAARLLRENGASRYDALHGFEEGAWIAAALASSFGIPFVYDMDSNLEQQVRASPNPFLRQAASLVGRVDRWVVGKALAIVTVCGTLSDTARAVAPGKPVYQIEDAPNVITRGDDPDAAERLRRRLELPPGELVVYTGNLEPYQGVDLLVRAAPLVLERHPSTVFLIVGGEPAQIEHLRAMVPAGARRRVVFPGQRPEEEMATFLAAADVLVSPRSSGTNTPLKLYSYLMAGRALVVTDRPVHTQLVSAEQAVLAEPSPEGLADALGRLLEEPERRRDLGRSARLLGEQYGPAAFAAKTASFLAAIGELIRTRPAGAA